VLRDPRQKRFFKAKDMSDLFQLGDQYAHAPETAQIFAGINSEIPLIEAGHATHLTTPSLQPPPEDADTDALLDGGANGGGVHPPEEGGFVYIHFHNSSSLCSLESLVRLDLRRNTKDPTIA